MTKPAPTPRDRLDTMTQASAYDSPWSLRTRMALAAWSLVWLILYRPTPKPCVGWRRSLLRVFGARLEGRPFVGASTKIKMPWNLTLEDRACLAPDCEVYNLGPVIVRARATVAQRTYLCAGTHDLNREDLPLVTGPIEIGADAFVGAQALILPGVIVGEGAVVGAGSVVTRDIEPWSVVAGNPARQIAWRDHPRAPQRGAS